MKVEQLSYLLQFVVVVYYYAVVLFFKIHLHDPQLV